MRWYGNQSGPIVHNKEVPKDVQKVIYRTNRLSTFGLHIVIGKFYDLYSCILIFSVFICDRHCDYTASR